MALCHSGVLNRLITFERILEPYLCNIKLEFLLTDIMSE
ncbi:hypothetical protein V144x_54420 [Gimesia aquarii]|uniref:Uncharacterized protein n=1 Tax=Gimesia aquarii TaxID=2527964 RepID=A0A517W3V4_9PLAN|nr:hypothetical protein V144x_54420 [Gimesia aquarii]